MNIHLAITIAIRALIFLITMFPIFCLFKTLVIVGYMNIPNNFKFVLKTMVGINAISCIFNIFLIILSNIIVYRGSIIVSQYYSPLALLPYYRVVEVICMYSLTVLLEWICLKKAFASLKVSPKKLLTSSFIGNVIIYAVAAPIYFVFFAQ